MAELLDVSFATVNRWENSKNEPTIKVKRKIKELCDQNGINMDVYSE
jgi:DNA-binding XRE family transcriptional regulator